MTRLRTRLILLAMIMMAAAARAEEFHVAMTGSDSAPGTAEQPFATTERARDAVRELKQREGGVLKQSVTVWVHGGTYRLAQPLRFAPEDSGTPQCPVTYAAFGSERPVLSGGQALPGWKEAVVEGKHLWTVDLPAVREGKWYFRELWVNGGRRPRARHPNTGFFRITAVPDLDLKQNYFVGQNRFQYAPGELAPWKNNEDLELVLMTFWVSSRRGIAGLEESKHMVSLNKRSSMRLTDGFGQTPKLARFYVENACELLDSPGEWYLDRQTGVLYYLPMPGEKIAETEAVAPALDQLVLLEGSPEDGRNVEHLSFRGLAFFHSGWWLPADGTADRYQAQASAAVPGAIQLYGAKQCRFEQCTIAHVSSYAIHFSRGCEQDQLVGSELFDLGAGGVKIGEPDRIGNIPPGRRSPFPDDPKLDTHDIEVADNDIREGGRIFHQGQGIWVGQSYNNLVTHNEIHDFYQIGISVGWTWGYGKSLARNNVIEYNHIHHIGQRFSSDLGAIYTLGTQPGTVIRGNLLHDIECAEYVGRGIYLDEGSADIVVEKNIVYHTTTGGFGMNYGRRNTIRNNIFAFGEVSQLEPVGNICPRRRAKAATCSNGTFSTGRPVRRCCAAPGGRSRETI